MVEFYKKTAGDVELFGSNAERLQKVKSDRNTTAARRTDTGLPVGDGVEERKLPTERGRELYKL